MRQDEIEHLLEDPVKNHERIMQMLESPQPAVVYKDFTGKQPSLPSVADNDSDQPPFSDEQIDIVAQALADLRLEFSEALSPLTEQVAVLQGQVNVLTSLIGSIVGNGNKMIEASETKTTRRVKRTT